MAILNIPDQNRTISGFAEVKEYLAGIGIDYERWEASRPLPSDATAEDILQAYAEDIETLKFRGGYVTADVINVSPATPGLDEMLAKFSREHIHSEDEVRFIVHGRGLFHINPKTSPVVGIEVGAGDLIRVPQGTLHWFNLCADRTVRTIRLFKDPAGWAAIYSGSSIDAKYEPLCLGPAYIPSEALQA
ncbi:MAG TPA: cupin domain-containing protein [Blastocatellia bacterium]|nr:cupin domain-containing protein [Blastocatellia bacterium]